MPPERTERIDPQNRMGIDFHAGRAFQTRFEVLPPDQRRAAIELAPFRNKKAHEGEREKFQRALLAILNRLEGRRTPEQEQLLTLLSGQIDEALGVCQNKPGIDITKAAMQAWLDGLAEQTLNGILEYNEPRVVVVPPVLTTQLLEMIGGKNYWPEGWNDVQASAWKFGVTDGIEDLDFNPTIFYINPDAPEDERIQRTNEQMVLEHKRRLQSKGQDIMPQYAYVPAAATVIAQGKVLDRKYYTAFERPRGASLVPNAFFSNDRVGLGGRDPGDSGGNLRCRPWVEGV